MKQINETMQVRMTLEEANKINELIKRDKPMPLKSKIYGNDDKAHYYCPSCDHFVGIGDNVSNFCDECGQHLDTQNTEL